MRDIKFRVWDYQRGAWARESEALESMGFEFGVNDYFNNNSDQRILRWDFMQYTGLKDKNEKDIYEGDLIVISLCYEGDYLNTGFLGEVIFEDGMFCVSGERDDEYLSLDEATIHNYELKVVGNKHDGI